MRSPSGSSPTERRLTLAIAGALTCSVLLSIGCVPARLIIPDPTVPHQVAEAVHVVVWARTPDGKWAKTRVDLLAGWWIAGPPVVEPLPPEPAPGSLVR